MRRIQRPNFFFFSLVALALVGCCGTETAPISAVQAPAVAASPCAPPIAASPCASPLAMAAQPTFALAKPVGVEMRVGAPEVIRSGLAVPPQVAQCFVVGAYKVLTAVVETANCALANLVPVPAPTARYVWALPAPVAAPAPVASPGCP